MMRFLCCCQAQTNPATEPVTEALGVAPRLNAISNNHALDDFSVTTAGTCSYHRDFSGTVDCSPPMARIVDNAPSYEGRLASAQSVVVKIKTYPALHTSSFNYIPSKKTIHRTQSFNVRPSKNDEINTSLSQDIPPMVPARPVHVKRTVSFNLPADKQCQKKNFQRY